MTARAGRLAGRGLMQFCRRHSVGRAVVIRRGYYLSLIVFAIDAIMNFLKRTEA